MRLCFLIFVLFIGWSFHSAQSAKLTIALRQQNIDKLEDLLYSISNPKSKSYGKYLSTTELAQLLAPLPETVQQVQNWLASFGIKESKVSPSGDFLEASIPDDLISTMKVFTTKRPRELRSFVDGMVMTGVKSNRDQSMNISNVIQPTVFSPTVQGPPNVQKKAYGIPEDQKCSNNTVQMVWGPGTYGILKTDLEKFYKLYQINSDPSLLVSSGFPGVPGGDNFGEATLDATYISSFGLGATTIIFNSNNSQSTEEGPGFGPAFLNFVSSLANKQDVPSVISLSLGSLSWASCDLMCRKLVEEYNGNYDKCLHFLQYTQRQVCMYNSADEVSRISVEMMKLGTRGVTILAATGDGGSHFSFGPFAPTSVMANQLNKISCKYNFPTFPASSPYVIGVGGTEWKNGPDQPVAWSGSGSGFAWEFAQPQYQTDQVTKYLQSNKDQLPPAESFNSSNRAYPDVSALSIGLPMVLQGSVVSAGGTSGSTPIFAGIISLLNDIRVKKGLPTLGFVNPRLYQIAADHPGEAFYDVTSGNSQTSCATGFPASVGWDPTTGLGSPLWTGLLKYLTTD